MLYLSYIFFFFFLLVPVQAKRDFLLSCLKKHIDLNKNHVISIGEIDTFLLNHADILLFRHLDGDMIMNTCDLNGDRRLTILDWDSHNACITSKKAIKYVQKLCKEIK